MLPPWAGGGKVSPHKGTSLHGGMPGLWSAPPEPSAEKLKQETQLGFSKFAFHFSSVKVTGATVFFTQLTNYILAQFNLSTISQSKPNKSNQTGLCFLRMTNPVCQFHLSGLLLFNVLNQRREQESFAFGWLVGLCVLQMSLCFKGYKHLITEKKFH